MKTDSLRHAWLLAVCIAAPGCDPGGSARNALVETGEKDKQVEVNDRVDGEMDALQSTLAQDQEQFPILNAIPTASATPLSAEDGKRVLKEATRVAMAGKLDEAVTMLDTQFPSAEQTSAWQVLRAELLALQLHRDHAVPLAARCAAWALQQDPKSSASDLRNRYRRQWQWAWRYEGRREAVHYVRDKNSDGTPGPEIPAIYLQGYTNQDLPTVLTDVRRRLQHYHVEFFSAQNWRYLGSYALVSRELLAEQRVYYLERRLAGKPTVIQAYASLPAYDRVMNDVIGHLEKPKS